MGGGTKEEVLQDIDFYVEEICTSTFSGVKTRCDYKNYEVRVGYKFRCPQILKNCGCDTPTCLQPGPFAAKVGDNGSCAVQGLQLNQDDIEALRVLKLTEELGGFGQALSALSPVISVLSNRKGAVSALLDISSTDFSGLAKGVRSMGQLSACTQVTTIDVRISLSRNLSAAEAK
jgi:hypothetical protein